MALRSNSVVLNTDISFVSQETVINHSDTDNEPNVSNEDTKKQNFD